MASSSFNMNAKTATTMAMVLLILLVICNDVVATRGMSSTEKKRLKEQVLEMFRHAYDAYMTNAFPADELMPLSCKGRYRGSLPYRGDIDDTLGNFTLTLIDTLDTLVVLGEIEEFERAVGLVIDNAQFDTDVVVSVFETNIRVLGGLLGGHILATFLKKNKKVMEWYNDELLDMATDVGKRLLPAFNTSTGIPYSRINLKKGITPDIVKSNRDTCTACAGTIILEFATLSRLTGDPAFEEKAHKAMDVIWKQRHRSSDLVGTVINVNSGDWIRRESGVGAGIDSYYEYVLKAYILLGDDIYLNRFNKHYDAVMKYISQGPMLLDVHMHNPQSSSRNFMDSLLAFWPGLQVLKGDLKPAIETHEMLYQVIQKHNFLPEAFTTDFRIHWGHHPLRPEFVESTYFLYKATGNPHYLEVGKQVMENLNAHARVPCGFAAIKDVQTGVHEDQMDSFVLAETFKYLYLLFSEKSDLILDIDDYVFSTEAHLFPLSLSMCNTSYKQERRELNAEFLEYSETVKTVTVPSKIDQSKNTCPNLQHLYKENNNALLTLRNNVQTMVDKLSPLGVRQSCKNAPRLKAAEFMAGNQGQLEMLRKMGIKIVTMEDGRIQLLHSATDVTQHEPMVVQVSSAPYYGSLVFKAGPAQFGYNLKVNPPVQGKLIIAEPYSACSDLENAEEVKGKIVLIERGQCMFIDKGRILQKAGALGAIVIDHTEGSTSENQPLFAMSGDGQQDVQIPVVFLFYNEGHQILNAMLDLPEVEVVLAAKEMNKAAFKPEAPSLIEKELNAKGPDGDGSADSGTVTSLQGDATNQEAEGHIGEGHEGEGQEGESIPRKSTPHLVVSQERRGDRVYRLETVSTGAHLEVDVSDSHEPKSPDPYDDDIIHIVTLPNGQKQLSFKLHDLTTVINTQPQLNDIYTRIVQVLQMRTNFGTLDRQGDYLMAIARLLEAAYFKTNLPDSGKSQNLFNTLANDLVIYPKQDILSESLDEAEGQPYASIEELEEVIDEEGREGVGERVTVSDGKAPGGEGDHQSSPAHARQEGEEAREVDGTARLSPVYVVRGQISLSVEESSSTSGRDGKLEKPQDEKISMEEEVLKSEETEKNLSMEGEEEVTDKKRKEMTSKVEKEEEEVVSIEKAEIKAQDLKDEISIEGGGVNSVKEGVVVTDDREDVIPEVGVDIQTLEGEEKQERETTPKDEL